MSRIRRGCFLKTDQPRASLYIGKRQVMDDVEGLRAQTMSNHRSSQGPADESGSHSRMSALTAGHIGDGDSFQANQTMES